MSKVRTPYRSSLTDVSLQSEFSRRGSRDKVLGSYGIDPGLWFTQCFCDMYLHWIIDIVKQYMRSTEYVDPAVTMVERRSRTIASN